MRTIFQSIPAAPRAPSPEIHQVKCTLLSTGCFYGEKITVVIKPEATPQVTENTTWHQKIVLYLTSACTRGAATQCLAPSTHNTEIFPALENYYRITSGNEQMQQAGERI